jgi:hypothetical protein
MFNSSLPTDNLYKFLALAGVALIIFSFYLSQSRMDLLVERLEEFKQGKLITDISRKRYQLRQHPDQNAAALLKEEIADLRTALFEENLRTWRLQEATLNLFDNLQIVLYIGALLTAFGFTFWYTRVQKHLDLAIKKQAQS